MLVADFGLTESDKDRRPNIFTHLDIAEVVRKELLNSILHPHPFDTIKIRPWRKRGGI